MVFQNHVKLMLCHDYRYSATLGATTGGCLYIYFFITFLPSASLCHFAPLPFLTYSLTNFLTVLHQISSSGYIGRGILFQLNVLKSGDEYPGVALMM